MELSPYVSALRENLTAAAAAGDEQTRTAARVLAATIEPAARLAIMTALSDLAGEVTLALEDRVVEVRLDGQDVQVVVSGAPSDQVPDDEPPPTMTDPNGDISRITVRLLEELKTKAEEVAAARGVSLNSFVSQAVQGALYNAGRGRGGGGGHGQNWGGGGQNWGGGNWGNWGQWGQGQQSGDNDDRSGRGGRGSSRVRGWVEG
jgi:hypothetical protein